MDAGLIVAIVGVVITIAVIVYFVFVRKHPENAASHRDTGTRADSTGRGTQPGDVTERPAGPDAEPQTADGAPGPHAGPPAGPGQDRDGGRSGRNAPEGPER
ncbi:hypothetical protein BH23ACT3_BH23ACT3_17790 [soil metagenome]